LNEIHVITYVKYFKPPAFGYNLPVYTQDQLEECKKADFSNSSITYTCILISTHKLSGVKRQQNKLFDIKEGKPAVICSSIKTEVKTNAP